MPDEFETRTIMTLRTGTKICILIGLVFLVAAVYFYFVPITSVRTSAGAVFGCGSASSPATGAFGQGTCGRSADVNKYKAIAALVSAVLTAGVGALLFGVDRHEERRPVRDTGERDDDRDRYRSRRDADRSRFGDDNDDEGRRAFRDRDDRNASRRDDDRSRFGDDNDDDAPRRSRRHRTADDF